MGRGDRGVEKTAKQGPLLSVLLTTYCSGDQVDKNVAHIGDVHTGFWWGNLREGDYLEDLSVDGQE